MKILLNVILVINMCICENSIKKYDWHVQTFDRDDTDFDNDLKMQTALNKERQQDLLKFSGQTDNIGLNSNSFYNQYKINNNEQNKNIDDNGDNKENYKNLLNDGIYKNHEDKNVFESIFDENKNYKQNKIFQKDNDSTLDKNVDYNYNKDTNNFYMEHQLGSNNFKFSIVGKDQKQNENYQNTSNRTFEKNQKTEKLPLAGFESFVGTNLFDNQAKKCFTSEDVALLALRKDFESFIPKYLPECLFDERMVALLINYFYICHQMVTGTSSVRIRHLVQKAFYDTLGGYLHFYMVPVAKYSFYAGQINLKTTNQILLLHEESRKFLNTNGNGWKTPLQNVLLQLKSVQIEPLHIPENENGINGEPSFCMQLEMNTDENQPDNDKMIVQLPKLEIENVKGHLGIIWLPFRRKRTFDLKLESSSYIVVKFYETVTKCYHFENIDQEYFNQQFKIWLMENIIIHLSDEEFYPGLGAVLRVFEYLKGAKKAIIGIDKDLGVSEIVDEHLNKYLSYNISPNSLPRVNKTNQSKAKEAHNDLRETNKNDLKKSDTSTSSMFTKSKHFLRSLDFSQITIPLIAVTIPLIVILLVIIICCWKVFCKKKNSPIQLQPIKNSSSSSSKRFNSPIRFFGIRKKSASNTSAADYTSNENVNKKYKKSVQIERTPLLKSDTSELSSPIRNKKSKESHGSRTNSKSSWETTYT